MSEHLLISLPLIPERFKVALKTLAKWKWKGQSRSEWKYRIAEEGAALGEVLHEGEIPGLVQSQVFL